MGKTKGKKTIAIFGSVIMAVIAMLGSVLGSGALSARADSALISFDEKLMYSSSTMHVESVDGTEQYEDSTDHIVQVTLQYNDSFVCDHEENLNTYEEVLSHRRELKEYYSVINANIADKLGLNDYKNLTISNYSPFIQYEYSDVKTFEESDLNAIRKNDTNDLKKVVVDDVSFSKCATRNPASGLTEILYPFEQAKQHVGIYENRQYTGNGIKIASIDEGIPSNLINLEGTQYQLAGSAVSDHSFQTSSIFGGTSGIASNASLLLISYLNFSYMSCCEKAIDFGAQIITMSMGFNKNAKYYDIRAAYTDNLVKRCKVSFVNSAGNDYKDAYISSPGMGLNVITVASNDFDLAISSFSSGKNAGPYPNYSLAPNLTAPGSQLTNIPNIPEDGFGISGTSFSAPFVTGILALLMEEYPILQARPDLAMAVLSNSCTNALGQMGIYDSDCGFGIVNYENARKACQGLLYGDILTTHTKTGIIVQKNIVIPIGKQIRLIGCVLYDSQQTTMSGANINNEFGNAYYTKINIKITNSDTGAEVSDGKSLSNFCYNWYTNYSNTTNFTISLYIVGSKAIQAAENYGVSFFIQ